MSQSRTFSTIIKSKATIEGAGVRLKRVFCNNSVPLFDPFLLLDDLRSGCPAYYLAGFRPSN